MTPPLVHVLVINWNGLEHLRECFDSLLEGTYPNARFVLIDNASSDGSVEFVRETYGRDARVEIVQCPENLGWSRGNNVGLERAIGAGADYVFLLNNDTVTAPDAVARLVEAAERDPRCGGLAPKMLLYDNPSLLNSIGIECSIIASSWDIGLGRLDGPEWDAPRAVAGICGGAAFFRTEVLNRTGLLPDDFDIYLDDLDLSLRVWDAGYQIRTCPQAVVRHKFSATMAQGAQYRRKYFLNTRNRFRVILRNFPVARMPMVKAACMIGEARAIGRALLEGEPWRAMAHVRAWGSAFAYLPRAWAERARRRSRGLGPCRFWGLIRTDRMFYPGAEFPTNGWYAPRAIRGLEVRPISARAVREVLGGRLRLTLVNCYPALGPARVEARVNDRLLGVVETRNAAVAEWDISPGRLELTAQRIFRAEDTGERMDIGGWIALDMDGHGPTRTNTDRHGHRP